MVEPAHIPPLSGLLLAGGAGVRLGRDKGGLAYHGKSQADWGYELLSGFCARTYVSIRPEQRAVAPYASLPTLVDPQSGGPAAGLLSAWAFAPDAAWLMLAIDMPLIGADLLARLVAGRRASAIATAFRHPDGRFEPLCAIWEPAARAVLGDRPPAAISLQRTLAAAQVAAIAVEGDAARFRSVNTPADDRDLRAATQPAH